MRMSRKAALLNTREMYIWDVYNAVFSYKSELQSFTSEYIPVDGTWYYANSFTYSTVTGKYALSGTTTQITSYEQYTAVRNKYCGLGTSNIDILLYPYDTVWSSPNIVVQGGGDKYISTEQYTIGTSTGGNATSSNPDAYPQNGYDEATEYWYRSTLYVHTSELVLYDNGIGGDNWDVGNYAYEFAKMPLYMYTVAAPQGYTDISTVSLIDATNYTSLIIDVGVSGFGTGYLGLDPSRTSIYLDYSANVTRQEVVL